MVSSPVCVPSQVLTTIEGIIDRAVAGLEQDQPARRVRDRKGQLLGMENARDAHSLPGTVTQGWWGQRWPLLRATVTSVSS